MSPPHTSPRLPLHPQIPLSSKSSAISRSPASPPSPSLKPSLQEMISPTTSPSLLLPLPLASPSELNTPCGATNPNCPAPQTSIPSPQHAPSGPVAQAPATTSTPRASAYARSAAAVGMLDDCDGRREACVVDPRREGGCGPGICHPWGRVCGGEDGGGCPEGMVCFLGAGERLGGMCFPLRYGNNDNERSRGEEVVSGDQDGFQT